MNKTIRPEWCTTVGPEEYDIDQQMTDFVKAANKAKEAFYAIDVGKLWGLYLAFKEQQRKLEAAEKIIWIINNEPRLGDVIASLASKYNRGEFDHIIALKR